MQRNGVAPTRPVLRYHGGKWMLAPWIISHFPAHRVYVEPFGGAASVLMRKPRSYAEVYNDLDGEVVNLFRVLRDPAQAAELERLVRLTPFARAEFVLSYEPSDDPMEQARRTIVRAFLGFGSDAASGAQTGFRSNSFGSNRSAPRDWMAYPDQVPVFAERLAGVQVECKPAVELVQEHDGPDTLFYVDPPYVEVTRSQTTTGEGKGYRHEMADDDHRELAEVLHGVDGMVVLSGYPCDLYDRELYPDWHRVERKALADGARERTEVLWLNDRATKAQQPTLFDMEVSDAA